MTGFYEAFLLNCRLDGWMMGNCQVCGQETKKVAWGKAIFKIFICSEECLQKYFAPLGFVRPVLRRLDKPGEEESWLN